MAGFADAVEIGSGGFGVVYRCMQAGLSRVVAVKVLTAGFADSRARIIREATACSPKADAPTRQQTLAGRIGWSYDLCTVTEQ